MTYFLLLLARAAPLLVYAAVRCYAGWAPGVGSSAPGVTFVSFPAAIPVSAAGSGAASTVTVTLAGTLGKVTWIEGVDVSGLGATAAGTATLTISGLAGGTLTYTLAIAAGATAPAFSVNANVFQLRFPTPLPAGSGGVIQQNAAITVSVTTFGAGNTSELLQAYGVQA